MEKIIFEANDENIEKAANHLKNGGLVAFPTETIYGLGANATSDNAVARIYEAKGRPNFNPLIAHFADMADAEEYVEFDGKAKILANFFTPGPLTMILPRKEHTNISLLCAAGLPTLAVRVPRHKVARELIKKAGVPIAAPSANRSGTLSPTSAEHVYNSLGDAAEMILSAGNSEVGLESTIIDMTRDIPVILRAGAVTKQDLEPYIGQVEIEINPVDDKPKCPGQLLRHYAPKTKVRLNATDINDGEVLLAFGELSFKPECEYLNLSEEGSLREAAANLFSYLHKLDKLGADCIAVMPIPDEGLGLAVNDRLSRAARG